MKKIILEMSHITKEFPGVRALDDVTFKVEEGEIHFYESPLRCASLRLLHGKNSD